MAVGAPRALICYKSCGIAQARRIITDSKENGAVGGGVLIYSTVRGNYARAKKEKRPHGAPIALISHGAIVFTPTHLF